MPAMLNKKVKNKEKDKHIKDPLRKEKRFPQSNGVRKKAKKTQKLKSPRLLREKNIPQSTTLPLSPVIAREARGRPWRSRFFEPQQTLKDKLHCVKNSGSPQTACGAKDKKNKDRIKRQE